MKHARSHISNVSSHSLFSSSISKPASWEGDRAEHTSGSPKKQSGFCQHLRCASALQLRGRSSDRERNCDLQASPSNHSFPSQRSFRNAFFFVVVVSFLSQQSLARAAHHPKMEEPSEGSAVARESQCLGDTETNKENGKEEC